MRGIILTLAALIALAVHPARAQDFPNRTITMIVPFPPGGGNDTMARIVAAKLSAALGQQVVVDNRPGANGVHRHAHSGPRPPRTVPPSCLPTRARPRSISRSIRPPATTRARISCRSACSHRPASASSPIHRWPANNVAEFIALAKREPGKLSIGTSPPGSGSHLSAELFKARTGIDVTFVPYKGAAALNNDLIGGHIPAVFSVLPAFARRDPRGPPQGAGDDRTARIPILPDVPTVAETIPGFRSVLRYGLLVPAGTPQPIIARLNKELQALAGSPEVQERINNEAGSAMTSTPAEYAAEIVREDALWGRSFAG
jgi:tripartite-type tricarboxylate transporter receptor subunit TctC